MLTEREKLDRDREYRRRVRAARRLDRLCPDCGGAGPMTGAVCLDCQAARRKRQNGRREYFVLRGRCRECGAVKAADRAACPVCLDKRAARQRAAARKEAAK